MGDFNIHDEPAVSFVTPAPILLPTVRGDSFQQTFWRRLFGLLTEVTTGEPTRFDPHTLRQTRIDRVFTSLPPHAIPNLSMKLAVLVDPTLLSDRRLSDHAILGLTLATARPKADD
eukprot:9168874-Pyramimonas_sp.AAC.1